MVTPTLALGDSPGAVALDLAVDASRPTLGVGFTTRSSPYVRDGIVEATARGYSLLRSGDESQLGGAAAVQDVMGGQMASTVTSMSLAMRS